MSAESDLASLEPTVRVPVMELVRQAGIDVSDWANTKGRPASNPKYCYEWAFKQDKKVVLLNLWHANMKIVDESIVHDLNLRQSASRLAGNQQRRAIDMDVAIQHAVQHRLPVRVVVLAGLMRDIEAEETSSKVSKRCLDPVAWAVTSYDPDGQCRLQRGAVPSRFVDQFSAPEGGGAPKRIDISTSVYARDPKVRETVLLRSQGKCEFCDKPGFLTAAGDLFLETHHIVPLSESGADDIDNVIALCPDDHRKAHFSAEREAMRQQMLEMTSEWKAWREKVAKG